MIDIDVTKIKYGFLRETQKKADLEDATKGKDPFGFPRTGMDIYLKAIYPGVDVEKQWNPNKWSGITYKNGYKESKAYPDYRYDDGKTKVVIEIDGTGHYKYEDKIKEDYAKDAAYIEAGYKVIRIPYFIQLTNKVVKQMFGVDAQEPLFPEGVGSMTYKLHNTPHNLCDEGIRRMAHEFLKYPDQYEANVRHLLKEEKQGHKTDVDILMKLHDEYEAIKKI